MGPPRMNINKISEAQKAVQTECQMFILISIKEERESHFSEEGKWQRHALMHRISNLCREHE